jgi:N utilization substance protein B
MGTRRQARETTLQMLYMCDICGFEPAEARDLLLAKIKLSGNGQTFALDLFEGTWRRKEYLDELITRYAENWEMDRMAVIDRNILRLATFEIANMPETPISVIIDEAVEIAKKYSTQDSGKFVNGILDKLKLIREQAPKTLP